MLFWVIVSGCYILVACGAILLSIVFSFLSALPWAGDDSPTLGILWSLVFCAEASLFVPVSLAITAELIDRKVHVRRLRWCKVFFRFLLALPVCVGPLYATWWVAIYVEDRRPMHWVIKEAVFYSISGVFAYFALRIKNPNGIIRQSQEAIVR